MDLNLIQGNRAILIVAKEFWISWVGHLKRNRQTLPAFADKRQSLKLGQVKPSLTLLGHMSKPVRICKNGEQ